MESNAAQIDPGEALAAVLGVRPVLSAKVETISPRQLEQAAKLPETIRKRARALVADAIVPAQLPSIDYQQMLEDTSKSWHDDQVQVMRMVSALPDGLELAYVTVAAREFALVQKALPKAGWKTYVGTENLEPEPMAMLQFTEIFAAVDDPVSYVFGAIADGSISRDVAKIVRATFPTITAAIDAEIHASVIEKASRSKGYALPWRAEIGVAAWAGLPPETPAPSAAPAPAPEAGAAKDDPKLETEELTPSQRVESGSK